MSEEVGVPAGALALALEAALALVLPQQRYRHAPEHRQVLSRVAGPGPALVLAEHHVQDPVQPVLDAPVPPDRGGELPRADGGAADEVVPLLAVRPFDPALAVDHHHRLEVLPLALGPQPLRVVDHRVRPLLPAAVAGLLADVGVETHRREVLLAGLVEAGGDVRVQRRLVLLDRQHVVAFLLADLGSDPLLAAHGVDGGDGPGQLQGLQQLGHGRDLVGVALDRLLAQRQAVLLGPDADQVQAAAQGPLAGRAAHGLAVDLHALEAAALADGVHPADEAVLEGPGAQGGEDAVAGVVGGDAVGQFQEALEPPPLGVAELLHVVEAVGAAEDGARGEDEDVLELVLLGAVNARVGQGGEVAGDRQVGLAHGCSSGLPRWSTDAHARRTPTAPASTPYRIAS